MDRLDRLKHWYYTYEYYCCLCGRSDICRERRYTKRPTDWWERHKLEEGACGSHFM